jgi:hypothetical protein
MKTSTIFFAFAALFVSAVSANVGTNVPPGGYGPMPGSSCYSVAPSYREACCKTKTPGSDPACPAIMGSTCRTVNPVDFDKCCERKRTEGVKDETCPNPSPSPSPSPAPSVGADCASRGPFAVNECCIAKKLKGVEDPTCASATCGYLAAANVTECCYRKGAAGVADDYCMGKPVENITCAAHTNAEDRAACCLDKATQCPFEYDPTCTGFFNACNLYDATARAHTHAHSANF